MRGKIFISYRRGDDPGFAGRLFDQLQSAFDSEQLFMDVDNIAPGVDFVGVVEAQLSECDVLLAIIGQGWLDARDQQGRRRLDLADDFVRQEIETGLRLRKRVIPVLVNNAQMPRADQLPESIKGLARRNALRLTHERFKSDTQGLIDALSDALEDAENQRRQEQVAKKVVVDTPELQAPGAPAGEEGKRPNGAANARPLVKLLIELGPLIAFFLVYSRAGIYWATGVLMAATIVSLVASWGVFGRLLVMPVVTAVLVVVFGGLTFWLDDPSFIKIKPTIINLLFAGVLLFGLITRRPLLKMLFGEAFNLTEEGWRILSVRWAVFFLILAVLNELVWRNFSEGTWVSYKVFGILPLTLVFAMAQIGLIKRHEAKTGT